MAMNYRFLAADIRGLEVRGTAQAESEKQLRERLAERHLTLLSCRVSYSPMQFLKSRYCQPNMGDVALMTRQLATMVSAAMPLEEALYAVENQTEKPSVAVLIGQLRDKIVVGFSFQQALAAFPRTFERFYCSMVAAGEASGYLGLVLLRLAEYIELRQKTKNRLLQAFFYPTVLSAVSLAVVIILLTLVVPQVMAQFQQMNVALPWATSALLAVSNFLTSYVIYLLVGILIISSTIFQVLRHPRQRLRFHRQLYFMPVTGRLLRDVNAARYVKTMSILVSSAVPLLESMRIAASVINNDFARQQLILASEQVYEGEGLSKSLSASQLFSPMMKHMIAAGESSGTLNAMLLHAATLQDDILQHRLTLIVKIAEQAIILVMAGMVLFIIMSILQPILQLNNMV